MNLYKSKREALVVILADGTKIKLSRYGKRNKLKNISEVVRLAIAKLLGINLQGGV